MLTKEERRASDRAAPKCLCGCGGNAKTGNNGYCTDHEPQTCGHANCVALVDWGGSPRHGIRCLDCGEERYF